MMLNDVTRWAMIGACGALAALLLAALVFGVPLALIAVLGSIGVAYSVVWVGAVIGAGMGFVTALDKRYDFLPPAAFGVMPPPPPSWPGYQNTAHHTARSAYQETNMPYGRKKPGGKKGK